MAFLCLLKSDRRSVGADRRGHNCRHFALCFCQPDRSADRHRRKYAANRHALAAYGEAKSTKGSLSNKDVDSLPRTARNWKQRCSRVELLPQCDDCPESSLARPGFSRQICPAKCPRPRLTITLHHQSNLNPNRRSSLTKNVLPLYYSCGPN